MASSSVLPVKAPPAAAQGDDDSANGSGRPYLNNAERVFEYTIDYEVRYMSVLNIHGSRGGGWVLGHSPLIYIIQWSSTFESKQDEAKLHKGIRDAAREIVEGWQGLANEDMGITVISEFTSCMRTAGIDTTYSETQAYTRPMFPPIIIIIRRRHH